MSKVQGFERNSAGALLLSNPSPIGQALQLKLLAGQGGIVQVLGDSTSDAIDEWASLMSLYFARTYPTLRVEYLVWADGGSSWPASTVVQAGDGSHGTLYVYNCSVGGKAPQYFGAPYFDAMVAAVQADLIFVNMGHNEANAAAEPFFRDDLLALTEAVSRAVPRAELVILSQNPRTDGTATNQAQRRHVGAYIANMRGYGWVDTYRVYLNADGTTNTSMIQGDGIHPTAAAEAIQWAEIEARLAPVPGSPSKSQGESSLARPVTNFLLNGDFASFAAPPTLTSWTATNATLSQDATNLEGPNAYSVRGVSASAAIAYFQQAITGASLRPLLGEWVTLAARVRIPSGANANCGRIGIFTTGGSNLISSNSTATLQGQGGFRWITVSGRVDKTAGTLTSRIFVENGTTGTGDISVDRAILAKGPVPRDLR